MQRKERPIHPDHYMSAERVAFLNAIARHDNGYDFPPKWPQSWTDAAWLCPIVERPNVEAPTPGLVRVHAGPRWIYWQFHQGEWYSLAVPKVEIPDHKKRSYPLSAPQEPQCAPPVSDTEQ